MERYSVMFGAFAVGIAAAVIIRKMVKKEIPLSGDTSIPLLGITLNERDKKLLVLAGVSLIMCIVFMIASYI